MTEIIRAVPSLHNNPLEHCFPLWMLFLSTLLRNLENISDFLVQIIFFSTSLSQFRVLPGSDIDMLVIW